MGHHLITFMVLIPFLGAIIQAFSQNQLSRWVALGASSVSSLCGIALVASMQTERADLQMNEYIQWVGSYAISYDMGVDGLNVLLVLLMSIVFPLLLASEWNQRSGIRGVHGLLLILQSSLLGAVCAQDLFLMFFFWAMSALPFYFLIGIWGGADKENSAFKSIIYASIGNALFFAALILVYYSVDPHTFSLRELSGGRFGSSTFSFLGKELSVGTMAFALASAGLALRVPIWPFHGWFIKVAEEAPPSAVVAASAASVPVATYIFVRLTYSLFPETVATLAGGIIAVGVVNLVMGGVCAAAQRGLRRLLAFICLGEVGLILIGLGSLTSAGVVGAIYQQLVLGLGLAGFGLFSGIMIERTGQSRFINDQGVPGLGGVVAFAPAMAVVAGIVMASLLGVPGFGGFVGHALLMIGSYSVHPVSIAVAGAMLLLATYYLFKMYRSVFLGSPTQGESERFLDLTFRERAYLLPLVGGLVLLGLYPKPLIDLVRPTVLTLLSTIR